MDLGNNVTLIGVLKKKEKHANNPDIKRPVLELETVYFEKPERYVCVLQTYFFRTCYFPKMSLDLVPERFY